MAYVRDGQKGPGRQGSCITVPCSFGGSVEGLWWVTSSASVLET